jgi:hypothetical protein
MPDSIWFGSITGFASNDVYGIGYKVGATGLNTYYFLHWDGNGWTIENSFTESAFTPDKFGSNGIISLGGKLFSVGSGIFQKTFSGWERIFGDRFTRFRYMNGTSESNLFAVGNYNMVYHFNGTDWFRYTLPRVSKDNVHYSSCWTDDRGVFIVGDDGSKSYVLHGK